MLAVESIDGVARGADVGIECEQKGEFVTLPVVEDSASWKSQCDALPVKAVFSRYKAVLSSIKQACFSSGEVAVKT